MKQILSLSLALLPCLAWAQYPSNGNQKITLGEQTTADGLVWRGLRADTTSKIVPFSDTSAYIILDTVEKTLWLYKAGQVPKWQQVGGSTLDTATMLLPYWRSGRFSGVLPVANGGTNLTTFTAANRIPYASSATALTTTNKFTFDSNGNKLIIGKNDSLDSNPNYTINLSGSDTPAPVLGFRLYNTTLNKVSIFRYDNNHSFVFANNDADNGLGAHRFRIGSGSGEEILTITRPTPSGTDGRVGIGTASPSEKLHVVGNGLFTGSVTANSLSLTTPLPVANGGTNTSTLTANKVMVGNGTSGVLTPTNLHWDNTNSRLGIGTASPEANEWNSSARVAHIYQNTTNGAIFKAESSNTKTLLVAGSGIGYLATTTNSPFAFYTNTTEQMRITSGGEVNIGYVETDNGAYRLQVKDSVYVGGNVSASAYTTRSDYNLKDDIFNIKYGLNDVLKLQPVEYTYKSNGSKQLGFIAQDIGTILPEVVSFEESMSVNYQAIIPILTKAIQEQQALIKALEQRIINLENK